MRFISAFIYITVFLPLFYVRKGLSCSRFERRFHKKPSSWDVENSKQRV